MDLSFRWRNTSTNINNSLGLDTMIHDISVLEHQRLESVNVSHNATNIASESNLVKFEKKKKTVKTNKQSNEPKKMKIFEKH